MTSSSHRRPFLPRRLQWSTFTTVLSDERFLNWLKSSLLVASLSTLIVLVVAIPAAYYTARFSFAGRTAFLFVVLITQMFSPTSLVVGIYREFYEAGLVNTYASIILTNAAFNLAFAIWILQSFFAAIPKEVEEASHIDGCSRVGTLWRVMLPLARPAVVTAVIFTFIAAWNEYVVALTLMQDDAKKPLTVGISSYVTGYEQHWDELSPLRSSPSCPSSSSSRSSRSTSSAASPPAHEVAAAPLPFSLSLADTGAADVDAAAAATAWCGTAAMTSSCSSSTSGGSRPGVLRSNFTIMKRNTT